MFDEKDRLGDEHPEWKKESWEKASPAKMGIVVFAIGCFCLGTISAVAIALTGDLSVSRTWNFFLFSGGMALLGIAIFAIMIFVNRKKTEHS